ncbi:tyrosine-protein phosphatase [Propionibacteriaceae bacterium Y1685]
MEQARWEGATNLRHLTGVVWRMGLPERITSYGWQQLLEAGVTTLVDLRNEDERGQRQPDWAGVDPPPVRPTVVWRCIVQPDGTEPV